MCVHEWLHGSCTRVCKCCGLERPVLHLDIYNVNSAPIERGYNRRQRFKVKVDKLLGLHTGPDCNDPVWLHLEKHKLILNTPFDVRECLRSSRLKNKHYDNLRAFVDAFTLFRVPHCQLKTKQYLLSSFDVLYGGWNTCYENSFFSYAWLLRHFLVAYNSPLVVYLKPKTCKRRNAKYLGKMKVIQSRRNGGIPSCGIAKIRFLNERVHLTSLHSPQCQLWSRAAKVLQYAANDHSQTVGHLLRVLPDRNSRATDDILT